MMELEGRLYNTGKHMWRFNEPASYEDGRVVRRKLGPCPFCGHPTSQYGGGFSCLNQNCRNSRYNFTCHTPDSYPKWWDEDIFIKVDGNAWCAYGPDFEDLQVSPSGFGETPDEAVKCYLKEVGRGWEV